MTIYGRALAMLEPTMKQLIELALPDSCALLNKSDPRSSYNCFILSLIVSYAQSAGPCKPQQVFPFTGDCHLSEVQIEASGFGQGALKGFRIDIAAETLANTLVEVVMTISIQRVK